MGRPSRFRAPPGTPGRRPDPPPVGRGLVVPPRAGGRVAEEAVRRRTRATVADSCPQSRARSTPDVGPGVGAGAMGEGTLGIRRTGPLTPIATLSRDAVRYPYPPGRPSGPEGRRESTGNCR